MKLKSFMILSALFLLAVICCVPATAIAAGYQTTSIAMPAGVYANAMAVNSTTNMTYVVNTLQKTVTVIYGPTNKVVATINVLAGASAIAVNPRTNLIYVANSTINSKVQYLTVINGASNSIISTPSLVSSFGITVAGIAVNPVTNKIYIADSKTNSIFMIDGAKNTLLGSISNLGTPSSIAVNETTNTIYVTNSSSRLVAASVTVINGANNTAVKTLLGWNPSFIAVNSTTNTLYVVNPTTTAKSGDITVINGANNAVKATVAVNAYSAAFNPTTNTIYAAAYPNLVVINGATNTISATVSTTSYPYYVVANLMTGATYTGNPSSNIITSIIPAPAATISASPNPCILNAKGTCTSTITWNATSAYPSACIFVCDINNSNCSVFACSQTGSSQAPWITKAGVIFNLRVSNSNTAQLLASVTVKGTAATGFNHPQSNFALSAFVLATSSWLTSNIILIAVLIIAVILVYIAVKSSRKKRK